MTFNNFEGSKVFAQGVFAQDAVVAVRPENLRLAELEDHNRRLKFRNEELSHWYTEIEELCKKLELENGALKKKLKELEEELVCWKQPTNFPDNSE